MVYLLAIVVGVFFLMGIVSMFSRDHTESDYHNYHNDPYYYYPRNSAPPNYQSSYGPTPYYQPYRPPYVHNPVRPENEGSSFFAKLMIFTVFMVAAVFFALKTGLVSVQITLGAPQESELKSRNEFKSPALPPNPDDYNPVVYAKDR